MTLPVMKFPLIEHVRSDFQFNKFDSVTLKQNPRRPSGCISPTSTWRPTESKAYGFNRRCRNDFCFCFFSIVTSTKPRQLFKKKKTRSNPKSCTAYTDKIKISKHRSCSSKHRTTTLLSLGLSQRS